MILNNNLTNLSNKSNKNVIQMPLVKIEILKGYSKEYKKAILDAVHDALVESIKIPDHDRFQRLYELEKENFEFPPQ